MDSDYESDNSVHSHRAEEEAFRGSEDSREESYEDALRDYAQRYQEDQPEVERPMIELPRQSRAEAEEPTSLFPRIPGESRKDASSRFNQYELPPPQALVRSKSNATDSTDYTIPGTDLVGVIRKNMDFRTLDKTFVRTPSNFGNDCRIQSLYPLGILSKEIADFLSHICNTSGRGVSNYYPVALLSYYTGRSVQFNVQTIDPSNPIEGLEQVLLHRDLPDGTTLPISFQRAVGEGHTVIFIKWKGNCYLYDAQNRTTVILQIGHETQVMPWINFLLTGPYISFSVMIYVEDEPGDEPFTEPPRFEGGKKKTRRFKKKRQTRRYFKMLK